MQIRTLGKTGIKTSILGFGVLRPPRTKSGKADVNETIRIIRKAIDNGVTFVDTAYNYLNGKSEVILGKALKEGYREKVTLMTKCPIWSIKSAADFDDKLNEQLKRLDEEFIDIYIFHNLNEKRFKTVEKFNLLAKMKEAKADGKIRHIGFSSHASSEEIKKFIDVGVFEFLLVQYSLIDNSKEEIIQYAVDQGLGVGVMGPVGGGRLALEPTVEMRKWLTKGRKNFADLALKFAWSNPNVSVTLSGMGSEKMVNENIAWASSKNYQLTDEERKRAEKLSKKFKEMYDLNCTDCGYCEPCPNEVNIRAIFKQLITSRNPLQMRMARSRYRKIGELKTLPGKDATACDECGECEEKCPQEIPIRKRLKEAHALLSKDPNNPHLEDKN
jgi:predicted aldo/keto reductase-like oxidoreductase